MASPGVNSKKTLTDLWGYSFGESGIDPSTWTKDLKTAILLGALVFLGFRWVGMKMNISAICGLLAIGLKNISVVLVGGLVAAAHGWKTKNPVFLGIGVIVSYYSVFGISLDKVLGS